MQPITQPQQAEFDAYWRKNPGQSGDHYAAWFAAKYRLKVHIIARLDAHGAPTFPQVSMAAPLSEPVEAPRRSKRTADTQDNTNFVSLGRPSRTKKPKTSESASLSPAPMTPTPSSQKSLTPTNAKAAAAPIPPCPMPPKSVIQAAVDAPPVTPPAKPGATNGYSTRSSASSSKSAGNSPAVPKVERANSLAPNVVSTRPKTPSNAPNQKPSTSPFPSPIKPPVNPPVQESSASPGSPNLSPTTSNPVDTPDTTVSPPPAPPTPPVPTAFVNMAIPGTLSEATMSAKDLETLRSFEWRRRDLSTKDNTTSNELIRSEQERQLTLATKINVFRIEAARREQDFWAVLNAEEETRRNELAAEELRRRKEAAGRWSEYENDLIGWFGEKLESAHAENRQISGLREREIMAFQHARERWEGERDALKEENEKLRARLEEAEKRNSEVEALREMVAFITQQEERRKRFEREEEEIRKNALMKMKPALGEE